MVRPNQTCWNAFITVPSLFYISNKSEKKLVTILKAFLTLRLDDTLVIAELSLQHVRNLA